jgi:hypothetical protein
MQMRQHPTECRIHSLRFLRQRMRRLMRASSRGAAEAGFLDVRWKGVGQAGHHLGCEVFDWKMLLRLQASADHQHAAWISCSDLSSSQHSAEGLLMLMLREQRMRVQAMML